MSEEIEKCEYCRQEPGYYDGFHGNPECWLCRWIIHTTAEEWNRQMGQARAARVDDMRTGWNAARETDFGELYERWIYFTDWLASQGREEKEGA